MPTSPFLRDNWAPVTSETGPEGVPIERISGSIPTWVRGSFVRIGPNPKRPPDPLSYHFFLGDGMVHAVEFGDRGAVYRNAWVQTHELLTGDLTLDDGSDERSGLANTAMVWHRGLLCLEEGSKPWEVQLPLLQTVGRITYDGKLTHNFTAHPKVCPVTNELVFFGYDFSDPTIQYSVVSSTGELVRTVPIQFREAVMSHDMAITPKWSILMDFPLWDRSQPTREQDLSRLGVFPRHLESESCLLYTSPSPRDS
eukprot:TRINITY_DN19512_c0_g1_i3.p1 TRINITY_DN19512_c0_g1~~TRINITY_DN19512_c0_g1_i3.p1  ORF type:complete len:254 (+),score=42.82 TRINITY_DN19512_c0_g1_i3:36-797(+)